MVTRLNLSAKFDRVVYNNNICAIQDFKSGWTEPVPAKLNAQMRVQALLVALNLKRIGVTPKRFIVQIVTMPFGVLQAEFSYGELAKIYEDITDTLKAIEDPDALLNPSIDACNLCPAILVCNAVKSLSIKLNPIDTNPDALCHNMDKIKILEKHMEQFEAFIVKGLTEDPPSLSIRDWEMVPGAEKRDWKPGMLDIAGKRLVGEFGIILSSLKTHTPAAYEKLYAAHYDKNPEDVREAFNSLFADCIEVKRNKASLKRIKPDVKIKAVTCGS